MFLCTQYDTRMGEDKTKILFSGRIKNNHQSGPFRKVLRMNCDLFGRADSNKLIPSCLSMHNNILKG
uniref:AlNc14C63G4535 protein n=2 Tax=Albugo laibachii Nc14 TaxID=890382 RepID=F0WD11_9STRA|nr:AlNc14C63G4535 [Albugo laibachii Nc14]|eukprot:CCA19083.1 AlNc14C63G4535 [Albugo laibachii Nc14]